MSELQGDNLTNSAGTGGTKVPLGIVGSTSGTAPGVDDVGGVIRQQILLGAVVPLTTAVPVNLMQITLLPGRWKVQTHLYRDGTFAASASPFRFGASLTSAAFTGDFATDGSFSTAGAGVGTATTEDNWSTFNVSVNTTLYFVIDPNFSGSCNAAGFIEAVRQP